MEDQPIDHEAIFDAHPDGIGEVPAEGVPGHTSIHLNTVRTEADLRIQRGRFGKLRTEVEAFREKGLTVGLKVSTPGQIDVFVAEHADSIKKVAAVGAAATAAVAGAVIYMHHKGKK